MPPHCNSIHHEKFLKYAIAPLSMISSSSAPIITVGSRGAWRGTRRSGRAVDNISWLRVVRDLVLIRGACAFLKKYESLMRTFGCPCYRAQNGTLGGRRSCGHAPLEKKHTLHRCEPSSDTITRKGNTSGARVHMRPSKSVRGLALQRPTLVGLAGTEREVAKTARLHFVCCRNFACS